MIPLADYKKLLGIWGKDLTDDEVQKIYNMQCQLADVIFDKWLVKHNDQSLEASRLSVEVRHNVTNEGTGPKI